MREERRIAIPKPPGQRASAKRIKMIKSLAQVGAIALVAIDAKVSFDGFTQLQLPQFIPLVLALLILAIQLCSGAVQQLGMNPFRGVGGSEAMDFLWRWVLVSVYVIDIGSNAIAFGIAPYLSLGAIVAAPMEALTMPVVLGLLACLLTFGDEILLRLIDRLDVGSKANEMAARKMAIDSKAYARYLQQYEQRAINYANSAGSRSQVDFDWIQHGDENNG